MKIGEFSRNGKSRDQEAKKAVDHDMNPEMKLVPYGILDVLSGNLSIFFGTSFETSDFIVDCLEDWWGKNSKKGIRFTKKEMDSYNNRIKRSHKLPKWDVVIETGSG